MVEKATVVGAGFVSLGLTTDNAILMIFGLVVSAISFYDYAAHCDCRDETKEGYRTPKMLRSELYVRLLLGMFLAPAVFKFVLVMGVVPIEVAWVVSVVALLNAESIVPLILARLKKGIE